MLSMPAQIDIYEQICALSAQMVGAAQANDWERLVELEKSVSALRDVLMVDENGAPLSPGDAEIKLALIQRILDDDAEIRRHTEPWMDHLRQILGDTVRRGQLEHAYGVR